MTNKVSRPHSNGKRQCKDTYYQALTQCSNRCIFFIMNILTFIRSNRAIPWCKGKVNASNICTAWRDKRVTIARQGPSPPMEVLQYSREKTAVLS